MCLDDEVCQNFAALHCLPGRRLVCCFRLPDLHLNLQECCAAQSHHQSHHFHEEKSTMFEEPFSRKTLREIMQVFTGVCLTSIFS